jgi:hypothetical protein
VQNAHRVANRLKHLIETLVAVRRLIESSTAQFDPSAIYPGVHHFGRDLAGTLDLSGLAIDNACRLTTAQRTSRAVHSGIERIMGMLVFNSFENDRLLTHRAANKSGLARKGRRRTLAYNPQLLAFVLFAPGVVVMVVHLFDKRRSQDLGHAAADPVTSPARRIASRYSVPRSLSVERTQGSTSIPSEAPAAFKKCVAVL